MIWVAVGGRGTLFGAAFGAVLVNYAKTFLTGAYPEIWLFFLGALFVIVTIALPRGLVGLIPRAGRGRRQPDTPGQEQEQPQPAHLIDRPQTPS